MVDMKRGSSCRVLTFADGRRRVSILYFFLCSCHSHSFANRSIVLFLFLVIDFRVRHGGLHCSGAGRNANPSQLFTPRQTIINEISFITSRLPIIHCRGPLACLLGV